MVFMGKMFMLSLVLCLFSATLPADDQKQESQAAIFTREIATIGKFGRLKLRSGVFAIVDIAPLPSSLSSGGLTVLTMDKYHNRYVTLFGGVNLTERGIDKDKFATALRESRTVIDCKTENPIILNDMVDFIRCSKDFIVHSPISITRDQQ
jgi:hypothetical protein